MPYNALGDLYKIEVVKRLQKMGCQKCSCLKSDFRENGHPYSFWRSLAHFKKRG